MKHLLLTAIAAVLLVGCGNEDDVRRNANDLEVAGDAKLSLSFKYRDGQMLLKVKVYPYKGTVERTLNQPNDLSNIMLVFKDEDGFEIFEQDFKLKDMRNHGDEYLEIDSKKTITEENYNLIKKYSLGRAGFVE